MRESDEVIVLSVEDDDAAYTLIRIAFSELGSGFHLHRAENGEEALAFLRKRGRYADAPRPSLLLLNLNLPGMTGMDVLTEMHKDDAIKDVPAVVFSSSQLDQEKAQCLALGARAFITKPNTIDEFFYAISVACAHAAGA